MAARLSRISGIQKLFNLGQKDTPPLFNVRRMTFLSFHL
jgi:hypothetical protein